VVLPKCPVVTPPHVVLRGTTAVIIMGNVSRVTVFIFRMVVSSLASLEACAAAASSQVWVYTTITAIKPYNAKQKRL
jgi:hypothetical protein